MDRLDVLQSLVASSHRLVRIVDRELGSRTPAAQWRTLAVLREEGPMRIGELAAACRVTQPGITRLVAAMTDEGLVAREHDESDARATRVRATDAGLDALERWETQLRLGLAPRFMDLGERDWDAIARVAALLAERTRESAGASR